MITKCVPKRINPNGNYDLALLLTLFYVSSDTLMFGSNGNSLFIQIRYIVNIVILLLLSFQFFFIKINLRKRVVFINILAIVSILFSALINSDFKGGYIYKIILILLVTLFVSKVSIEKFYFDYDNIMYLLSIASIVGYGIYIILPNMLKYLPIIYNTKNTIFYNAYFDVIKVNLEGVILRNYGIFREPGVYQLFLILALIFQMFVFKKISLNRCAVYITALITTFSTTGYIALAGVLLAFILTKSKKNFSLKLAIMFTSIIFILYAVFFTDIFSLSGPILSKFSSGGNASAVSRFASIRTNIILFIRSPIFGTGLYEVENSFKEISWLLYGVYTNDNTNCILIAFAAHGLIYGLYCIIGIYRFLSNISQNIVTKIIFFFVLILQFSSEDLSYSFMFYLLISYGYINSYNMETRPKELKI